MEPFRGYATLWPEPAFLAHEKMKETE